MAYTHTATIPPAAVPQNITLPGLGDNAASVIEVTKTPDAGDMWFRFDGLDATPSTDGTEYLPSGNPSGTFHVGNAAVRVAQAANAPDVIISVTYVSGGDVHFRS